MTTLDILKRTKAAWPSICNASAEDKNRILSAMADSLQAQCDAILRCNAEDMDAARGHISDVMLDRLYLDRGRVDAMADGIRATVALPDHTGRILAQIDHPNGMKIYKSRCRSALWRSSMRAVRTSRPTRRRSPSRAATSVCSAAARRLSTRPRPSSRRSSRALPPSAAMRTSSTSSRTPATRAPRRSCRPRVSSTCSSRAAARGSSVPVCAMPPCPALRPARASATSTSISTPTSIRPYALLKTPRPAALCLQRRGGLPRAPGGRGEVSAHAQKGAGR